MGSATTPHGGRTPDLTVVVVDDDASLRALLTMLLRRSEHLVPVGAAADGKQALALVAETQPDVILLDLLLVGERGTDLIAPLLARAPQAMVAMLTSMPAESEERACLEAGAFAFYEKSAVPKLERHILDDHRRFRAAASSPAPAGGGGDIGGGERDLLTSGDEQAHEIAHSLVELMAGALQCSSASLWRYDDEAAYQIAHVPSGRNPTLLRFAELADVGASIRAGEVQLLERGTAGDPARGWMERAGVEVSVRIPVPTEVAAGYVVDLAWDRAPDEPVEQLLPLARRLAGHAARSFAEAVSRHTRQATVLELSDNVAQALVAARGALELEDLEQGRRDVDRAYAELQRILVRVVHEDGSDTIRRLDASGAARFSRSG